MEKLKVNDIYLKQLNYRFITDFESYLRTCVGAYQTFYYADLCMGIGRKNT
ncbi:hypothetical protein [Sinomicrobium oceani]|uniref:hypothetical protein n=1 Tax=Sinomicrobium oceani TaxID=1150368 RepID=UPI0038B67B6E